PAVFASWSTLLLRERLKHLAAPHLATRRARKFGNEVPALRHRGATNTLPAPKCKAFGVFGCARFQPYRDGDDLAGHGVGDGEGAGLLDGRMAFDEHVEFGGLNFRTRPVDLVA